MNNKGRITFQSKKKAPLYPQSANKAITSLASAVNGRRLAREAKLALQKDVDELKKKLRYEENVHRALERAFSRPLGALPRLPPYLPQHTLELLAEVAVLEEEVVRLEEQIINFRKGLYEDDVHVKSQRKSKDVQVPQDGMSNRKCKHQHSRSRSQSDTDTISPVALPSPALSRTRSGIRLLPSAPVQTNGKEVLTEQISRRGVDLCKDNLPCSNSRKFKLVVDSKLTPARKSVKVSPLNSMKAESIILQLCRVVDQAQEISSNSSSDDRVLETEPTANKLSEDILNCLSAIFLRLSKSRVKTMNSDPYSCLLANNFSEDNELDFRDPYCISSEIRKRDIGPYKHLCAIEASSIDLKRATIASFLIRRLKLLLDKLASVNVENLNHQQKLAFWINIYNSCMMNAFLDHGIPDSEEMVVAVMQKATITVGGKLLNAITIEHFILRLPYHLTYTCPKTGKRDDMKPGSTFGLEWSEPLVTFALSCGSWSSPAVRVYSASQVETQLEAAKREYLQATVGISSANKIIIPKLLDWYLLDFAKDFQGLLEWICMQLPYDLRNATLECLERREREPLSQIVEIIPYSFNFRYLIQR